MSLGAWRFRTTNGVVTVRDDAVTLRSSPGQFLAGQTVRWHHGNRLERVKAAFTVGAFLASVVAFVVHLSLIADTGFDWSSLFYATSIAFFGYSLWRNHGRTSTIPRSAIESVTLDADSRRFTITHRTEEGLSTLFREDVTETTLTLGTDDDLREAREIFRLRGIEIQRATDGSETEYTHRIVGENGGYHCEQCGALVTPNDKVCRACDRALWVEASEGV